MIAAQMRAQMSYRASFIVEVVGSTLFTTLDLLTVLVIFHVTKSLAGFSFPEAFLMATIAGLAFAMADMSAGNVDRLRAGIRTGQLDALLVRPLGVLRQLIAADFELRRFGRIAQGIVALAISLVLAKVRITVVNMVFLVLTLLAATTFFSAVFVMGGSIAFWWIDSGEFANGFTFGGRDFTSYPITVYETLFRRLFAFGLGFAFVAYYPALTLLRRRDPIGLPTWTGWLTPLVAAAAVGLAAIVWRTGIRHYRSTGS